MPNGFVFLYGEAGLGKSHLLNSLGNAVKSKFSVRYTTCEDFCSSHLASISSNALDSEFMKEYTECDVFLLDDFQNINNNERSQSVFLSIIKQRMELKKLTVIASNQMLEQLPLVNKELINQLESFKCVELNIPDFESKKRIAYESFSLEYTDSAKSILEKCANSTDNPRLLINAITKLCGYCELVDTKLTTEIADKVLFDFFNLEQKEGVL